MTIDGYIDGEWYGHQGLTVIEWPPLENCLSIDADACEELKAVFHLLGADQAVDFTLLDEPKPWPFPTGVPPPEKKPEPEKRENDARLNFYLRLGWPEPLAAIVTASAIKTQGQGGIQREPAKSTPNGILTVSDGLHRGLGFNGE
jgi:hypothetical protein